MNDSAKVFTLIICLSIFTLFLYGAVNIINGPRPLQPVTPTVVLSDELAIVKGNWVVNCITEAKANSAFKGNEYHVDACVKQGNQIFKRE